MDKIEKNKIEQKPKDQIKRDKILSLLDSADKDNLEKLDLNEDTSPKDGSFGDLYSETLKNYDFKVGDIVKGRVISLEGDNVLVDINYKSEGVISKSEFRLVGDKANIQIGQELDVYIEHIENDEGMMVLSKDRADIIKIWKDISKVVENEEVIEGTVIDQVKGGLSVDIGVKAFLPGSQIDLRPVRDLSVYVGNKYQFKVIKFNQKRGNIVLSRRALLNQERKNQRSRFLAEIKEGAIVKGIVKNITDYGVFLDLGGLDGLLHITDMSWNRIKHPSELVTLGTEIEVKILKFDQEKNRVSLGLKQLTKNPWDLVNQNVKIGDTLDAKVVSLADYGAFMKLKDGVEGLVHVSEMTWGKKIKHPSQLLKIGEEVKVKVLGVDQENHRISLGIKQLQQNPWVALKEKYSAGSKLPVTIKSITDFGLFVEIKDEDVEGFIHVADLSWVAHISPKEQYKKGDELEVMVKEINVEDGRFNLSIKHLEKDPWLEVESKYPPGSRHEVKVKKIMDFGVFVSLEPGVEGLIHISELSIHRVEKPEDLVQIGDLLKVEVLSIDMEVRKIGLSSKQVELRQEKPQPSVSEETKESKETKKEKTESFFGRALKASLGVGSSDKDKDKDKDKTESTPIE